jgi:hypothetical protein
VLADVARFGPAEDATLIEACFCCPYCLRSPTEVMLDVHLTGVHGGDALCTCEFCAVLWRVGLDGDQVLRMAVAPPAGLAIKKPSS